LAAAQRRGRRAARARPHSRWLRRAYFADARRRPEIPDNTSPALRHYLVSRWDAPLDSGLRERALFDPGGAFERRVGCPAGTLVLVRPDEHIAAIEPIAPGAAERRYAAIVGRAPPSP
jgi:3-(3-hydroxy-phenyl)propionate hydroxylase